MKIAILWGAIFGILQTIISLVAGLYLSSPSALALSCLGILLSIGLAAACGLIGAIQAKAFSIGVWAGIIATAISVFASLLFIAVKPSVLDAGMVSPARSFAFFIGYSLVSSTAGAGTGFLISRQSGMNTGSDDAHELNQDANDQPVKTQAPVSKKTENLYLILAMLPAALAGFIGFLLTVWLPAQYYDSRINAQHPGAGAGATLVAFFLGTPLACLIGPLVGAFGAAMARRFAGQWPFLLWLPGPIAGALAGIVIAAILDLIAVILGAL